MQQTRFPWQDYGNEKNAYPAPVPSAGGFKRTKKRQRPRDDDHDESHKRHYKSKPRNDGTHVTQKDSQHPSGIPLPPRPTKAPPEVISLLDDDDDPPQRSSAQSKPLDDKYRRQTPTIFRHEPPQAGTQCNPFEIDTSSPAEHQARPKYNGTFSLPKPSERPEYNDMLWPPNLKDTPQNNVEFSPSKYNTSHANNATNPTPYGPPPLPPPTSAPNVDVVPILEPTLCPEQAGLVDLILSGRNVFYTGSAGCGKSTVLKAFVKRFRERGMMVNIVAPTGRAALDINGSTTWTYAGWTPDHHKKTLKELKVAAHGKFIRKRLQETDVLVIDEISMVENLHFERLNVVMKEARGSDLAFGGVQLIVTGDFCQLPPVKPFGHCIECGRELVKNKEETEFKCRQHGIYYEIDKWAFRSQAWKEANFAHVNLTTIHRQSDRVFIDILNKLRMGTPLSQSSIDLLLNHESETRNAIQLFATRGEVKRVNDQKFNQLRTPARTYKSLDHFHWEEKHGNMRNKGDRGLDGSMLSLREHRYEPEIQLKKGMLAVLLHNLELGAGLVNGSQGVIQGFEEYDEKKMPKAANNRKDDADMPGAPVLQGDHAAYRETRLKEYAKQMPYKAWPIVRFLNGVERTIYADCTVNELGDRGPYCLLSRTQIPLMAAWAMTTHKSQGMTLNRVIVNLSKSFEQGQAYVALSRARSLEGLKVESFPQNAQGRGNPQVKEFLREKFGIQC